MPIARKPVESSQITSVGYDPATRVLQVEFKSYNSKPGSVYEYENVEQEVADGFFREKDENGEKWSVGRHFGRTVKPNKEKYPYKKLAPKE